MLKGPLSRAKAQGMNIDQFVDGNVRDKGFGDTVERFTKATGIKKIVKKFNTVTGGDCGCKGRQEKLNKMFPYKEKKDV